ncbi:hypothetical protein PACTADRAFT_77449 [Pachysolen tannophilus NRRL Y-2460]|uniref:SET domain-containing protein n=1 Tax=Pachysolen tannophilus NRRL Y-2460 TaxID=669874 RepID=A0A1E4TQH8_PACTA|nr:hypothetical protein PACTADRAFT_77449 [Pachysolen tannophilus NRRL Y-2460]
MATTKNVSNLMKWLRDPENKCFWNEDVLDVRESPEGGIGVFAKKDLNPVDEDEEDYDENENENSDDLFLRISKDSILSAQNSCISNLLYDYGISGMQAVVLAFIYEKSIGESSPWYDYIQSINYYDNEQNIDEDHLILPPSLWAEEEQALLKGTEAEILGVIDPTEVQEVFMQSLQFSKNISNLMTIPYELSLSKNSDFEKENLYKFKCFAAICAAIASRAFEIDAYHELALVPGADLFNHDSFGNEHVHFETVNDVCPFCGREDGCGHNEYGAPDSEEEENESETENEAENWEDMDLEDGASEDGVSDEEKDGENMSDASDMDQESHEPLGEITISYINELEKELEATAKEDAEDEDEEEQEEDEDFELDDEYQLIPDQCVDIVLKKPVQKNNEIFNAYGNLSNPILLSKYGFTSIGNPNDYVGLGMQALRLAKSDKTLKPHFKWWSEVGFRIFQEYADSLNNNSIENGNHTHSCCSSDCGEEEEEEEEHDEEFFQSWELELRILSNGQPSLATYALTKLLTLNSKDLKKLMKNNPEQIYKSLIKNNTKSYKILLNLCEKKSSMYKDGGLTSQEYLQIIAKNQQNKNLKYSLILIQNEKKILEIATELLHLKLVNPN